jgi:hypothetical protein
MVLEDEKVTESRKLRRLEDQNLRGPEDCQPSYLLTFLPFTFLLSYFSKYLYLYLICLILFPLFSFLFLA